MTILYFIYDHPEAEGRRYPSQDDCDALHICGRGCVTMSGVLLVGCKCCQRNSHTDFLFSPQPPSVFQPTVCERELCVFAFQTLGVMNEAADEIATGAQVNCNMYVTYT